MQRHRGLLWALIICMLITQLSACVRESAPTPSITSPEVPTASEARNTTSDGNVIVSFAVYEDEFLAYRPIIEQFEREHANISVQLIGLNTALNTSSQGASQALSTPLQRIVQRADVFPAFLVASNEQASALLLNLQPYLEADAHIDVADFYPGTLTQAQRDSFTWMLPSSFRVSLISYNQELFARAKLAPPAVTWTWRDLLDTAEQFATVNQGSASPHYGLLDPTGGVLTLNAILHAHGSELHIQQLRGLQLDQPEIAGAIQELLRLWQTHVILLPGHPTDPSSTPPDPDQLRREGRIALWPEDALSDMGSTGSQSDLIGYVPFPMGFNPAAGQTSYGYAASAGTTHPVEVWEWIAYLSRQQLTDLSSVAPAHIPARRSVAERSGAWQRLTPPLASAYRALVEQPAIAANMSATPDPAAFELIQHVLDTVLAGKQPLEQTLAQAQADLETTRANQASIPTPRVPVVVTPQPTMSSEGKAITFLAPPNTLPGFTRLAEQFQKQWPDVTIVLGSTHDLAEAPSGAALAKQSDCFLWRVSQSEPNFNQSVLDLQPLIDAEATPMLNDYPQVLISLTQADQHVNGLPYDFLPQTLSYNRTMFEQRGLQPPSVAWQPDDFLKAASLLTKDQGGRHIYGYAPLVDPGVDLFFFIRQFGAALATGSGTEAQPHFTDPGVVAAIQWYLDLSRIHNVMPKPTFTYKYNQYFDATAQELIQRGDVGMWFAHGVQQADPAGFAQTEAPLPIGAHGLSGFDLQVQALYISAQSQYPEACWKWITFVTGSTPADGIMIPARTSLAQSERFQNEAQPNLVALFQAYQPTLTQNQPVENIDSLSAIDFYWFYAALTEVLEDRTELSPALEQAQRTTNAFMACLRSQTPASVCALRVDPSYQGYHLEIQPVPGGG